MSINLTIDFDHPAAISNRVQYARVDNIVSPSFVTVSPNIAGSSGSGVVIATNIPNGQYQVNITPIYADGRSCAPTIVTTPPCEPLISINAVLDSGNIVISYLAPSDVPKVRMTVNYPNGGSFVANYVNDGNNIVIPVPSGQTGVFLISGQSVCDESSGFFSGFSSQVQLTVTAFNTIINNFASGITISTVTGINGFVLPALVPPSNTATGNHLAFYGGIVCTFTGTPGASSSATLQINSTIIQCQDVPNTAGGTVTFAAANFADTDLLTITFSPGVCP